MVHASSIRIGKDFFPGYKLKRLCGKGGFGAVWEGQTDEGKPVALKFIHSDNPQAAAEEIKAIQFVSKLRHPNLIRTDKVWCTHGYVIVSMPLAEGSLCDLFEACQGEFGTAMKPTEVIPLLDQVASALDFLNTRQHILDGVRVALQHCDVKPSNILMFGETVKLCDFGLTAVTTSMLKPHRRAGTLDFMAPEVFQGRLSDHTDQYALAITYCQLRGGRVPFPAPAVTVDLGGYTRPQPDLSMLGASEQPIVARSLAPVPQDRWPSCRDLIAHLRKAVK